MQIARPTLLHIKEFGEGLLQIVENTASTHDRAPQPLTIEAVDQIIADTAWLKELATDLKMLASTVNKTIFSIEQKAGGYLKALGREDYESPAGRIELTGKWAVRMPKDEEAKLLLFEHLKERGLFERYATVNSRSLNSLYMADWNAAKKKDPDAWVTFEMPGVPTPTFDQFTKIKGKDTRKVRDDESDDE